MVKAFINKEVNQLLVDIGSSVDIMFYDFFRSLRILQSKLLTYNEDLIGVFGYHITLIRYVKLHNLWKNANIQNDFC